MNGAVVVGTAGHVDHGKTALVRALTGVETDRWIEERRRGLTIDIGFAPFQALASLEAGLVDVPGHEDFVKNMLAGCTGVDVLLLVVAADEGPMPQTREHLMIAKLLGVEEGVVALNKIDRVDAEWLALAREATQEELTRVLGHDRWPIIEVSARTGQGLERLLGHIERAAERAASGDPGDLFRMPVDRAFSVAGAGTVVTGTTWSGEVAVGDRVRLLPAELTARVRSLQVHGEVSERVGPGHRCAMALVGVDVEDAGRGNVIVRDDAWTASTRIGVRIEVPSISVRTIEHGQRVRLFLGTREVMARALTSDRQPISPGEEGWAVLDCEEPIVARVRDRFVLRFYSPMTTIAGGMVCMLDPPRGWRALLRLWTDLAGDEKKGVEAAVSLGGGFGISMDALPLVTGVRGAAANEWLERADHVVRVGDVWYSGASLHSAMETITSRLEEAHARRRRESMVPLESLRAGLVHRYSAALIQHAVGQLARQGVVRVEGPGVRLGGHEVHLSPVERDAERRLLEELRASGLAPPAPAELAEQLSVSRDLLNDLLGLLEERKAVVRISPEIYVVGEEEEKAKRVVREVADKGPVSPSELRTALGLSRKYLIPLLEHMDRTGVTRRTPEGRVLEKD